MKESLRLFPIAPFIGRFLNTDAIIGDYCIPKNTLALLSLYSAGRDEASFYLPNEFLPQRWLRRDDKSMSLVPFNVNASLPFAMGSRSCIGRKIALIQMQYLLSKICLLIIIVTNAVIGIPMVGQSDSAVPATADDVRVSKMHISDSSSSIYNAGIASVNGRFGKSIRAFTVNEFEKYIGGLA